MTKQDLRISPEMKKSAEAAQPAQSAEAIVEAILKGIEAAKMPFSKPAIIPGERSIRIRCEPRAFIDISSDIKKTMIVVARDCKTVNVRRDIDTGTDTVFGFKPIQIENLSAEAAAKLVVAEVVNLNIPSQATAPAVDPFGAKM